MMNLLRFTPPAALILLIFCAALCGSAPPASRAGDSPPFRVALIIGGPLRDYQLALRDCAEGLQRQGLIANGRVPLPEASQDLAPLWLWLRHNAGGGRMTFLADGLYSADWDREKRLPARDALLARIRDKGDVDAVICLGTWAGQDMVAAENLPVPVLAASISNAVEAGIILSVEDSGRDNFMAVVTPGITRRQLLLFHDIFSFGKLGIVYEDNESGRGMVSLSEIEAAAAERDFELVRCTENFYELTADAAADKLRLCHQRLVADGAEAVFVTYNKGLQASSIAPVIAPLLEAHLPTFSQSNAHEVEHGVLLGASMRKVKNTGFALAYALGGIMRGAKARDLPQAYERALGLAINLRTATRIGWNPPLGVVAAVDEFYPD